ncbi:MAG: hypothetical protein DRN71_04735 [Candidatus Nanohalarchaeota archaeon]|nr:MAG: hypothetical protein DRN71_04735 [Candidatus Nanohaloarchaeota archaeon]
MNPVNIFIFFSAILGIFLMSGTVSANIVINEVELNPVNGTPGDEWIELYNTDVFFVNLSGYVISDPTKNNTLPDDAGIEPNGFFLLTKDLSYFSLLLNNVNEFLTLETPDGQIDDSTLLLSDSAKNSSTWQRRPDGSDDWQFRDETKGESNGGSGGGIPEFPMFIVPVLVMFAGLSLAGKFAPLRL